MRMLASRRVVAKAKATVVLQRQNVIQQQQQQQKMVPSPQPTQQLAAPQQPGALQRLPASQRLGTRSIQQQQQQQPGPSIQKMTPAVTSAARPTPRPISDVSYS